MDKKGDYKYWVIIILVIGILVAIALIYQAKTFADIAEEEMDWETCRLSIIGSQISTRVPLGKSKIACPRYDRVFEEETSDEVNKLISEDILNVMRVVGSGELDFAKGNTFSSSKDCIVLTTYRFKGEDVKKEFEDPFVFLNWLKGNNVGLSKKTYYDSFENIKKDFEENKIFLNLVYDKVIKSDTSYFLYAVKVDESSYGSYFELLSNLLGLGKERKYWQSTFSPDSAKESFSEKEIEKILGTTRVMFADSVMLHVDCDRVYNPETKIFEKKWKEDYKKKGLISL